MLFTKIMGFLDVDGYIALHFAAESFSEHVIQKLLWGPDLLCPASNASSTALQHL